MNGSILSTVNDSLYTWNFPSQHCLYWQDISKTTASSDTDTTLSLALKFDAQNDKTIYLRYPMGVFSG
jgi:hypothetical protein